MRYKFRDHLGGLLERLESVRMGGHEADDPIDASTFDLRSNIDQHHSARSLGVELPL